MIPWWIAVPAAIAAFWYGRWVGLYGYRASVVVGDDRWWRWACGVREKMGRWVKPPEPKKFPPTEKEND